MTCKNILSHLEKAEEEVRQALINSLTEKDDRNLSDLFNLLGNVQDVIGLFPHPHDHYTFTTKTGKDLDNLDDVVVQFPTGEPYYTGNVDLNTDISIDTSDLTPGVTSIGTYKSQEHRPLDPQ